MGRNIAMLHVILNFKGCYVCVRLEIRTRSGRRLLIFIHDLNRILFDSLKLHQYVTSIVNNDAIFIQIDDLEKWKFYSRFFLQIIIQIFKQRFSLFNNRQNKVKPRKYLVIKKKQ